MVAQGFLSTVTIGANASVALISPNIATGLAADAGVLKLVKLPPWTPGKFIYVADSNGNAGNYPFGIGVSEPHISTLIVGGQPTSLNFKTPSGGTVGGVSSFSAVINRSYGAMAFVAGGAPVSVAGTPTQFWYSVINEGGADSFTSISTGSNYAAYTSTNTLDAGTINTQNLNFVGAGSVGFTSLAVSNFTASNVIIANGGISTTTLSTNAAYIGALTIGNASDLGIFNVGGVLTASGGITASLGVAVSGAALTTTGAPTVHSNNVVISNSGTLIAQGLTTLIGGVSTTAISSGTAYIGALTVGSATNTNLAVTSLITGGQLTITGGNTSVAALSASGLINANLGLTVAGGTTTVAALTASGLTTLSGGVSTTAISTGSAYIGNLTVGSASDYGSLNIGGIINAIQGITVSNVVGTFNAGITVATGATSVVALTASGLTTLSGGVSTTAISTGSAYIANLTVSSETITTNLVVGTTIAAAGLTITTGATSVAALTASGLATLNGGVSTTAISTASAYIGALTVGSASDYGTLNVGQAINAIGGIVASATTATNLLTANSLATLSGGVSTTAISTANAYIGTLRVAGETNTGTLTVVGTTTVAGLTASALINANLGLTVTGANTSVTSLSASALINANLGLTVTGGNTSVTSLTASGNSASDSSSTNNISSGAVYAGTIFYSVASY